MGTKIPTNQKGVVVCSFLLEKALVPIRVCILVQAPPPCLDKWLKTVPDQPRGGGYSERVAAESNSI